MKKKLILCIAIAFIAGQLVAIDYSIGISTPGFGMGILRGKTAENQINHVEEKGYKKDFGLSLFPVAQIDFVVKFLPFLALETGVGYGMSTVFWSKEVDGTKNRFLFKKEGVVIPIMVRGFLEIGKFIVYVSMGPKLNILTSGYMNQEIGEEKQDLKAEKNTFIVDLGFAIGGEYNITDAHYIGVRVGYDLNLISPLKKYPTGEEIEAWNHDILAVSITYRYVF